MAYYCNYVKMCFLYLCASTVELTYCKGDCYSQWKTPIFGPSQFRNFLTDFKCSEVRLQSIADSWSVLSAMKM